MAAAGAVHLTIVSESMRQKHLFIDCINQINLVKFTKHRKKSNKVCHVAVPQNRQHCQY